MKYRLEIRLRSEIEPRKFSVDEPRPITSPRTRGLICVAAVDFEGPDDLVRNDRLSLIYGGEEFPEHQIARSYDIEDQRLVFRYSDWRGQLFSDLEAAVRPMIELMARLDLNFVLRTDDRLDFNELIRDDKVASRATISFQENLAW